MCPEVNGMEIGRNLCIIYSSFGLDLVMSCRDEQVFFSSRPLVVCAAPSVANVQQAIEHIFPLVYEHRKERGAEEVARMAARSARNASRAAPRRNNHVVAITADDDYDSLEDEEELDEEELMDYPDSDESWD